MGGEFKADPVVQPGGLVLVMTGFIDPVRSHLQEQLAGITAHGEHEAELGAVDGAQRHIVPALMAHHQQRMIQAHLVAVHQQQLVSGVDSAVIHFMDGAKQ
ncbi:hypothetical protein D3C86_2033060 [compost metagenome]